MKRVAINGFGRIGRIVFRELIRDKKVEIVAINDISTPEELAYLLKYDSIHGMYDGKIQALKDSVKVDSKKVYVCSDRDALNLPWRKLGVDVVIECTGSYTKLEDAKKHIEAGAKGVVISAPGKGDMKTIVYGVNDAILDGKEEVISASSCTTNCLAPVLKVLNDTFGIESGFMTTVHAYTNDQYNLDAKHKKGYTSRRGRACAMNIIPTSTGAATSIGKVIPQLEGKLAGNALRVPVGDGSVVDLSLILKKRVTVEKINEAFKMNVSDTLKYTEDPIVSSDVIGSTYGALVDGLLTEIVDTKNGQMVKVVAWYDNEYGYSAQLIRTTKQYLKLMK